MSVTVLSDEARQNTVLMAKLAEQAERYDDMVKHMQKIARTGTLQMDERNLLSVAFKVRPQTDELGRGGVVGSLLFPRLWLWLLLFCCSRSCRCGGGGGGRSVGP